MPKLEEEGRDLDQKLSWHLNPRYIERWGSLVLLACEVNPSQGSEFSSQFADLLEQGTCSLPRPWASFPSCTGRRAQEDERG